MTTPPPPPPPTTNALRRRRRREETPPPHEPPPPHHHAAAHDVEDGPPPPWPSASAAASSSSSSMTMFSPPPSTGHRRSTTTPPATGSRERRTTTTTRRKDSSSSSTSRTPTTHGRGPTTPRCVITILLLAVITSSIIVLTTTPPIIIPSRTFEDAVLIADTLPHSTAHSTTTTSTTNSTTTIPVLDTNDDEEATTVDREEEEEDLFVDDDDDEEEVARDSSDTATVVPTAEITYDAIDEDTLVPSVPLFLRAVVDDTTADEDHHHEDNDENNTTTSNETRTRTTLQALSRVRAGNDANEEILRTTPARLTKKKQQHKRRRRRRFVAIHIGPIKTATTTIQQESGRGRGSSNNTIALQQDHVLYVGRYSSFEHRFTAGLDCSMNVIVGTPQAIRIPQNNNNNNNNTNISTIINTYQNYIRITKGSTNNATTTTTTTNKNTTIVTVDTTNFTFTEKRDMIWNVCWKNKQNLIALPRGLVLSDEFFSDTKQDYEFVTAQVPLWQHLFFDYLDFDDVILVGAYRRYSAWLVSAYKQRMKQTCLYQSDAPCDNVWQYLHSFVDARVHGGYDDDDDDDDNDNSENNDDDAGEGGDDDEEQTGQGDDDDWRYDDERDHDLNHTVATNTPTITPTTRIPATNVTVTQQNPTTTRTARNNTDTNKKTTTTTIQHDEYYGTTLCYNLDQTLLPLIHSNTPSMRLFPTNIETAVLTNTTFHDDEDEASAMSRRSRNNHTKRLKFDILNYFQQGNNKTYNSILAELYCKSLRPYTKHTCRYYQNIQSSSKATNNSNNHHHKNTGSIVNTTTSEATRAVQRNKGSINIVKYHDIVVKAKALGWIANVTFFTDNTAEETTERRRIREVVDLERYHTQHLGKNGTHHLPLLCPTREQLQSLLHKALQFERLVFPGLGPSGTAEHVRAFWEFADQKKEFCWLDIDRLFETATSWQDLLENRMVIDEWL